MNIAMSSVTSSLASQFIGIRLARVYQSGFDLR